MLSINNLLQSESRIFAMSKSNMKNFCFCFIVFWSGFLFPQRTFGPVFTSTKASGFLPLNNNNSLCDTSSHVFFGHDSAVCYPNTGTGNWGFVSGTNSYKDISKAEKFFASDYISGYQLAGGIFYFFSASDGSIPTSMKLSVWDDDGSSGYPKTELSSTLVPVSTFNDTTFTSLLFTSPVAINGNFYLGLDGFSYSTPQDDTIALLTSAQAPLVNTAYERWVDSSWHAFDEPNNWNFKTSFFIAAILCNTEVGNYEILNPGEELLIFPNPNKGTFTLNTGKSGSGSVQVEIIDLLGKKVFETVVDSDSGNYQVNTPENLTGVFQLLIHTKKGSKSTRLVLH